MPRFSLVRATLLSLMLVACSDPASSGPSALPSPTGSAAASPDAGTPGEALAPPACVEARMAWSQERHTLLLMNCVDQLDPRDVERIWAWDGRSWTLLADDGPPATVVAGVAYDAGRDRVVRYGGQPLDSTQCIRETWEWDGTAWKQAETDDTPTACDHLDLVYDAARGDVVAFGGGDEDVRLTTDTWAYDGSDWRRLTDAGPVPRAHFGFVYDDTHQQSVLFGGYDGSSVFNDLWTWDGARWAEVTVDRDRPAARSHFGIAIGPDGLLVVGGATGPATFATLTDESWLLTDATWTRVSGPGPSARGSATVGFDPERSVYVLYGGFGSDGSALGDTWEWDGDAWRCVSGCP